MSSRGLLVLAALVAAGTVVWFSIPEHRPASKGSEPASKSISNTDKGVAMKPATGTGSGGGTASSENSELTGAATATLPSQHPAAPVDAPPVPDTAQSSNLAPGTVLENMRTTIRQFASSFGENPVGTNPEITQALQGENPKHITFLKDDGNRVNSKGELVDVWGTPYFFHQISGHEMEIRSAGADRVMYTGDDLIIR